MEAYIIVPLFSDKTSRLPIRKLLSGEVLHLLHYAVLAAFRYDRVDATSRTDIFATSEPQDTLTASQQRSGSIVLSHLQSSAEDTRGYVSHTD